MLDVHDQPTGERTMEPDTTKRANLPVHRTITAALPDAPVSVPAPAPATPPLRSAQEPAVPAGSTPDNGQPQATDTHAEIESEQHILTVDRFELSYGKQQALFDINMKIAAGKVTSLIGPSGCGKSTLLSILGLLDTPSDGAYTLNDQPVVKLSLAQRARVRNREVGFIFQSFNLIGDLTVFENVELPLTYRGMRSSERKQRVTNALERVGMAHRAKHLPSQLSGGQQQRVAVARAVCGEPSILLADEPTGNLDSKNGEAVMDLLKELHQGGATICMVTHDARYASHAARTIHLFDGRVVEESMAAAAL